MGRRQCGQDPVARQGDRRSARSKMANCVKTPSAIHKWKKPLDVRMVPPASTMARATGSQSRRRERPRVFRQVTVNKPAAISNVTRNQLRPGAASNSSQVPVAARPIAVSQRVTARSATAGLFRAESIAGFGVFRCIESSGRRVRQRFRLRRVCLIRASIDRDNSEAHGGRPLSGGSRFGADDPQSSWCRSGSPHSRVFERGHSSCRQSCRAAL